MFPLDWEFYVRAVRRRCYERVLAVREDMRMRRILPAFSVFRVAMIMSVVALMLTTPTLSHAQTDALDYFKNYFVTGDYVAAGSGLRGLGIMVDPCLDQGVASCAS